METGVQGRCADSEANAMWLISTKARNQVEGYSKWFPMYFPYTIWISIPKQARELKDYAEVNVLLLLVDC